MTIRYEVNPPRVIQNRVLSHKEVRASLGKVETRIAKASKVCNGIHLTDSVLGIPRISPITTGAIIRNNGLKLDITASLRVRDRNITALTQSVYDAVLLGLDGLLILKGDEPPKGPKDSRDQEKFSVSQPQPNSIASAAATLVHLRGRLPRLYF